jgi:hypothetical protein
MKNLCNAGWLVVLLLTLSTSFAVGKQTAACSGDIMLSTQASVDAFPAVHGCTEITGKLTISGPDITNIDSLYTLTKVAELSIIGNNNLVNLNGLLHLERVTTICLGIGCGGEDKGFLIKNNALLSDVSGLSSLTEVIKGDLVISSNPRLASLHGLNNLVSIGGRLGIENNATLGNLDGLSSLATIGYLSLTLSDNPSLTSLEGLSLLTSIPGSLFINNNDLLPNLNGLDGITKLDGLSGASLYINGNASLTNIDALSAVTTITQNGPYAELRIGNNPLLANINGLQSLTEIIGGIGGVSLTISNNDSLLDLDGLAALDTLFGFNLFVGITDNASLTSVRGLSSLNLITQRPNVTATNNTSLMQCCGFYKIVARANQYPGGSATVSGNGAGCTEEDIMAGGPCCDGGPLPQEKFVFAENSWGYAPHATNILVQNYEPGIAYELFRDADNVSVSGPTPGNVGLYAGNVTTTTTYRVVARNPETGCERTMSTLPVIHIYDESAEECPSVPSDKALHAEINPVSPGGATNILVLQGDPGIVYVLRNDADDVWVAGPYPYTVGLYSGALYATTTFNVLALHEATNCSAEMSTKITVTVTEDVSAPPARVATYQNSQDVETEDSGSKMILYPNPSQGELQVELSGQFSGACYIYVRELNGTIRKQELLQKEAGTTRLQMDLQSLPKGMYIVSVYNNRVTTNRKLVIK